MIGIHMAMQPESLINADIRVQTTTTITVKIRSLWKIFILLRVIPIFWATPVWNRASPTMVIPAIMYTGAVPNPL